MENVFIAVTVTLLAAAVVTFIAIVRDVWLHFSVEARHVLSHTLTNSRWQQLRAGDKAIVDAWKNHVEYFPQSRKRLLFGVLVILGALSVMFYPLWLAVH